MTVPPPATLPITVVIPAYNRAAMIERALRSVFGQRTPPAEVLVVDDASGDDTAAVAAGLGARVITHERNAGAAAARNTGIRNARQPWIAFLDSDDEFLPDHLEYLWSLRGEHVLVAASALDLPDALVPRGARTIVHGPQGRRPTVLRSPGELISPQPISASAVMVRTEHAQRLGGFDTARRYGEDWDLWLRLLEQGSALLSPRLGAVVHLHRGGKHFQGDSTSQGWREILYSYADRPWFSTRAARRWETVERWDQLRDAMRERQPAQVLRHAGALAGPRALVDVVGNVVYRAAARRRTTQVSPAGRLTLARLPGSRLPTAAELRDRDLVDLSALSPWRAVLALARRPTSEAVAPSPGQARLLSALHVTPVGPHGLAGAGSGVEPVGGPR